jgi:hypothetical protein
MEDKKLIEDICRFVITNHTLPQEIADTPAEKVREYTQKLTGEKMIIDEMQKMKLRATKDKEYRNLKVDKGLLKAKYGIKL